ncbi:MAG: glucose 1-dehydrogenase [Anaerolineaceae bacterium]|nr:glucose 1-dehydrogenase [Anaerolineaceae bacterium]
MLLNNKTVLVTGAGSGIGRAAALALAAEGASIVVSDVSVPGGEETADQIIHAGGKALFVQADVTRSDDVAALVKTTVEAFGRLDVAVNNAGVSGDMQGRLHEFDEAAFDHVIGVNLKGVWLCMKHELPVMMAQNSGVIVNMSSVSGLIGAPRIGAYSASKHGVIGLTRTAAAEYARFNIRVNALCPAFTDTPMVEPMDKERIIATNPMKRLGRPEEIAAGVVWLCSDASSFVNGQALAMDGGLTAI